MNTSVSADELDELAFLNFTESLREFVRWSPGSILEETDETLRTKTAVAYPVGSFNAATYVRGEPRSPSDWIGEQVSWFREQQRGFTVHARAHGHERIAKACVAAGLELAGKPPVMERRAPFERTELEQGRATASDAQVRLARSTHDWQSFVDITALSYVSMGFPERITRSLMCSVERMQRPVWRCAIASFDGKDGAAALLLFSHSIAGLYWVGTRPEARGKRLAARVVQFLTNHAFEFGARAVVLQASDAGAPLYRRLGFTQFGEYPMYTLRT